MTLLPLPGLLVYVIRFLLARQWLRTDVRILQPLLHVDSAAWFGIIILNPWVLGTVMLCADSFKGRVRELARGIVNAVRDRGRVRELERGIVNAVLPDSASRPRVEAPLEDRVEAEILGVPRVNDLDGIAPAEAEGQVQEPRPTIRMDLMQRPAAGTGTFRILHLSGELVLELHPEDGTLWNLIRRASEELHIPRDQIRLVPQEGSEGRAYFCVVVRPHEGSSLVYDDEGSFLDYDDYLDVLEPDIA